MKFRGETVLLYRLNEGAQGRKLQALLARLGVRIRVAEESQRKELLGDLFRIPGFVSDGQPAPVEREAQEKGQELPDIEMTEPVMVMNGFSNARLGELLTAMKKAGMPRINLKAMLTQNNMHWTFEALYRELEEEHRQMEAYRNGPAAKTGDS